MIYAFFVFPVKRPPVFGCAASHVTPKVLKPLVQRQIKQMREGINSQHFHTVNVSFMNLPCYSQTLLRLVQLVPPDVELIN